jgi:cyclopropane-fatty-acyl-phospholipid synthase
VPPELFKFCLGKNLKYSSCIYEREGMNLDEAEDAMLTLTCERAQLKDGQRILELGCGWGSLSLWMASHYPNSTVTSVSNSKPQCDYINKQARKRGLKNIKASVADMNTF